VLLVCILASTEARAAAIITRVVKIGISAFAKHLSTTVVTSMIYDCILANTDRVATTVITYVILVCICVLTHAFRANIALMILVFIKTICTCMLLSASRKRHYDTKNETDRYEYLRVFHFLPPNVFI
jgi:hypothetical protein